VGKGMTAGEIVIKPRDGVPFPAADNSILGNTVMYGATGGHLYASGRGGERFCVRNSGGTAVVEGIGDHGCEYMTNGTVVILGTTGKNFGAGMSGGVAYVYNEAGNFAQLYNSEMIEIVPLDGQDEATLKILIGHHVQNTGSPKGAAMLADWSQAMRPSRPEHRQPKRGRHAGRLVPGHGAFHPRPADPTQARCHPRAATGHGRHVIQPCCFARSGPVFSSHIHKNPFPRHEPCLNLILCY